MRIEWPDLVLLIVGMTALCSMVAYSNYYFNSRLDMVQTHLSYTHAIHTAQQEVQYGGTLPSQPSSSIWANALKQDLPDNLLTAPHGGPTYVLTKGGNKITGAVGITATDFGRQLIISRPSYAGLIEHNTEVNTPSAMAAG